jgi:hypothetical protein
MRLVLLPGALSLSEGIKRCFVEKRQNAEQKRPEGARDAGIEMAVDRRQWREASGVFGDQPWDRKQQGGGKSADGEKGK